MQERRDDLCADMCKLPKTSCFGRLAHCADETVPQMGFLYAGHGAIPLGGWSPHYKTPGEATIVSHKAPWTCSEGELTMPVGSDCGPDDDLLLEQLGMPPSVFQRGPSFVGRPSFDERFAARMGMPNTAVEPFGRSISMGPTEMGHTGQGLLRRTSCSNDADAHPATNLLLGHQVGIGCNAGEGASQELGMMRGLSVANAYANSQSLSRRSQTLRAGPVGSLHGDGLSAFSRPPNLKAASAGLSAIPISCGMPLGQQHPIGAALNDEGYLRLPTSSSSMCWNMPLGAAPVGEKSMGEVFHK
jgi:hypothetical protein